MSALTVSIVVDSSVFIDAVPSCRFNCINISTDIFKTELHKVVDWSKVDKEDYLLAMERCPIKDIEIKHILKAALTDDINSREVYMKGIDHSYYYERYTTFKTEEL